MFSAAFLPEAAGRVQGRGIGGRMRILYGFESVRLDITDHEVLTWRDNYPASDLGFATLTMSTRNRPDFFDFFCVSKTDLRFS